MLKDMNKFDYRWIDRRRIIALANGIQKRMHRLPHGNWVVFFSYLSHTRQCLAFLSFFSYRISCALFIYFLHEKFTYSIPLKIPSFHRTFFCGFYILFKSKDYHLTLTRISFAGIRRKCCSPFVWTIWTECICDNVLFSPVNQRVFILCVCVCARYIVNVKLYFFSRHILNFHRLPVVNTLFFIFIYFTFIISNKRLGTFCSNSQFTM